MIVIGVMGKNETNSICNILKENIEKNNNKCIIVNSETQFNDIENIKNNMDYIIICMPYFAFCDNKNLISDIKVLIMAEFDSQNAEYLNKMEKIIRRINDGAYIIFNSDSLNRINFEVDNVIPISYGFNAKTTVTASSIDDIDNLKFSFCVQRSIPTISNDVVRPFEMPVSVKGKSEDTPSYLAVFTCCLVIGIKPF